MSLRSRIESFLNDVRPLVHVSPSRVDNFVDTVVNTKTDVHVTLPEFPEVPFADQLTLAIVQATATKGLLSSSPVDLKKYGDEVYRLTAALVSARNRNFNLVNDAHWTPIS